MIAQSAEEAACGDAAVGVFGAAEIHTKLRGVHDARRAECIEMFEQGMGDLVGSHLLESEAMGEATDK